MLSPKPAQNYLEFKLKNLYIFLIPLEQPAGDVQHPDRLQI